MQRLMIGAPAPGFTLKDLSGAEVSLNDFRGQVAVINFWSCECPWAERADQGLKEWQDRAAVLWVASNGTEGVEGLRRAAQERGLRRVLLDPLHAVADLYSAETTPHCFIVGPSGALCYQGAYDDASFRRREPTRSYVGEALAALLSGRPVPVAETQAYGCTIIRFSPE